MSVSISTHIQFNPVFILSGKTSSDMFWNLISFVQLMAAACWALGKLGSPWIHPRFLSSKMFNGLLFALKSVALPVPEIRGGS